MAIFYRQFNAIGPLFCSLKLFTTSLHWTTDVQNILETPKPRPKQKHRCPEPRKHRTSLLWCFPLVHSTWILFGTKRLFLKSFGFHQRVSTSFVSIFCNTMDIKKSQRVPLSQEFLHSDTVQKFSFQNFFPEVFKFSQGSPFIFFRFCNQLVFHKTQMVPPFYNFEPWI